MNGLYKRILISCCCASVLSAVGLQKAAGAVAPERVRDVRAESQDAVEVSGSTAGTIILCPIPSQLTLEAGICQADADGASPGIQIVVELWMRDLCTPASGFQAFVSYDVSKLTYAGSLSSYMGPSFPIHIGAIDQAADGSLELDGSVNFGDPTVFPPDELLATLVFDVLDGPSTSRLSVLPLS